MDEFQIGLSASMAVNLCFLAAEVLRPKLVEKLTGEVRRLCGVRDGLRRA